MSLTNKLCNSTPFDVKLQYERGINLVVPADGQLGLTMQQMDDFRPGKPGSEEVKKTLDYHGLFLLDGDVSYDRQALKALKASYKEKNNMRKDTITRIEDNRIASGRQIDDKTLEALVEKSGYGESGMGGQVTKLASRIEKLESMVGPEQSSKNVERLDPERTCFGTEPPREFASKTQLALFLDENPQLVEQHEALLVALEEE